MYKLFAFLYFVLPVAFFASIFVGKNNDFVYNKLALIFFLLWGVSYVLFPVIIFLRFIFQLRKDTSLQKVITYLQKKVPKLKGKTGLLEGLSVVFMVFVILFFAFFVALRIFIYSFTQVFDTEVLLISESVKSGKSVSKDMEKLDKKLSDLERKLYEDKRSEFYRNNEKPYEFTDTLGEYTIYNNAVKYDFPGFRNKYHYKFSFCLYGDENSEVFQACPVVKNDRDKDIFDNFYIRQEEIIEDYYVESYKLEKVDMPVLLIEIVTNNRTLSALAYPENAQGDNHDYIFRGTQSTVYEGHSETCYLEEVNQDSVEFLCDEYLVESGKLVNKTLIEIYTDTNGALKLDLFIQ